MKKIITFILLIANTTCFANCCDCINQYENNSNAIDQLAVNEMIDCFNESFPPDYYDLGEYGVELYSDPNGGALGLGISHDIYTWASNFSNCSNEILSGQQQMQLHINDTFIRCVQPLNCSDFNGC